MLRRPSLSLLSTIFKQMFSSEIAWPIKGNFHVESFWEGGTNVYINGSGHMNKMSVMSLVIQ